MSVRFTKYYWTLWRFVIHIYKNGMDGRMWLRIEKHPKNKPTVEVPVQKLLEISIF